MSAEGFSDADWTKINALDPNDFGLPKRGTNSAIIGTFNMLKLGDGSQDAKRWDFLSKIRARYDFLAIQEVLDDLSGLDRLMSRLPKHYEFLVSDTTGKFPGDRYGLTERLAFIYNPKRIRLDDLASDITYDRSWVLNQLNEDWTTWEKFFQKYNAELKKFDEGKRKQRPALGDYATPAFLTFIRQPHCAAFTILGKDNAPGIPFLAVNAHLLYGKGKTERKREFNALLNWLIYRSQEPERMYHTNMILLGDLNLEFTSAATKREEIDDRLRALNQEDLGSMEAATVNFPLLSVHPSRANLPEDEQLFRTNARTSQTYDQIGFFVAPNESRLPFPHHNANAGNNGPNGYDYGVFRFTDLIAKALHNRNTFAALTDAQQDALIPRAHADISDHLPAWTRIPLPTS